LNGERVLPDDRRTLEERGQRDLVRKRQGDQRCESHVRAATLNHTEMLAVNSGALRGQLLREPLLLADRPQTEPESLPRALDGALDRRSRPDLGRAVRAIRR